MYYRNYDTLKSHFEKTHHVCKWKMCLDSAFVVFKTKEELQYHVDKVHYMKGGKNATMLLGIDVDGDEMDENNKP